MKNLRSLVSKAAKARFCHQVKSIVCSQTKILASNRPRARTELNFFMVDSVGKRRLVLQVSSFKMEGKRRRRRKGEVWSYHFKAAWKISSHPSNSTTDIATKNTQKDSLSCPNQNSLLRGNRCCAVFARGCSRMVREKAAFVERVWKNCCWKEWIRGSRRVKILPNSAAKIFVSRHCVSARDRWSSPKRSSGGSQAGSLMPEPR